MAFRPHRGLRSKGNLFEQTVGECAEKSYLSFPGFPGFPGLLRSYGLPDIILPSPSQDSARRRLPLTQ